MFVIPEQFEAGGRIWDIKFVPRDTLLDTDRYPAHGLTDFDSATITLEENDSPRLLTQVFLHELSHVLLYSIGVFDQDNEETHRLIDALGSALLSYHMTKKGGA
jgi:Zn-dependent peptidase ImmA (M78 family)